ncbi:hypothetical protein F7725_006382 [Dissostichus mawsoni]|uniref:Uncharacterized protein n=1 Tax=Dissostichus mawsoni TaxID=36200 RepID=A0A7J5XTS4_DISMA|nr:hypothetical protein F7725_006382 [Dissostichus mawsoni]
MDLKALETKWRTVLSSILDQLTGDEFRKLLFNLEKIPQGLKEGRTKGSIALMDHLMKDLPRLDAAVQQPLRGMKDELKKLRQNKKDYSAPTRQALTCRCSLRVVLRKFTERLLSDGTGFKTVEEFNKGFFHMLPLTVTASMQGKRILEMRMI